MENALPRHSSPINDNNEAKAKEIVAKRIWLNMKTGNVGALGELYDLYIENLFMYGMYQSQDRNFVMDCIHDLFLDLYKYRKNLSVTDNVKYYLYKSLKRKIFKKYKRKNDTLQVDFETYMYEQLGKTSTISHEENIIRNEKIIERNSKISKALKQLSKKQRKFLKLRFEQEKTYVEISQIMDISVESVRTAVYRAIKTMRKSNFLI